MTKNKIKIIPQKGGTQRIASDFASSSIEGVVNAFDLDSEFMQKLAEEQSAIDWCRYHGLNLADEKHPATEASKLLLAISKQTDLSKNYIFVLVIDKLDWKYRVKEYVNGMRVQISRIKAWVKETHAQNKIRDINQGLSIDASFVINEFGHGIKVVEVHITRAPRGTMNKMTKLMQIHGASLMQDDFIIPEESAPLRQLTFINQNVVNPEKDWN